MKDEGVGLSDSDRLLGLGLVVKLRSTANVCAQLFGNNPCLQELSIICVKKTLLHKTEDKIYFRNYDLSCYT